jgi:hypothetical protein
MSDKQKSYSNESRQLKEGERQANALKLAQKRQREREKGMKKVLISKYYPKFFSKSLEIIIAKNRDEGKAVDNWMKVNKYWELYRNI